MMRQQHKSPNQCSEFELDGVKQTLGVGDGAEITNAAFPYCHRCDLKISLATDTSHGGWLQMTGINSD